MHDKYIKIDILENEFEAQVLGSMLKENNIPYRITSYHDTAFDGLYQTQKGWGYISSKHEYAAEIKETLADLRKNPAN